MLLWWVVEGETGFGQDAVDELGPVLDFAETAAQHAFQVLGIGEDPVGEGSAAYQRRDSLDRVGYFRPLWAAVRAGKSVCRRVDAGPRM